ncbi:hypothetical protein AVEN_225486-1 [Araneus ventricosus]|uniref:Uncharacterized protein n=1 Tax=Araneus ventricosus TaxID=182803 RepID=A0A4Y2KQ53_ARAVE|nr:hypothetical protein AVEN_225486-1 [Araneus ventricosus]
MSTWNMRSRRISKRVLTPSVSTLMGELNTPSSDSTYLLREGRAVAGDGYYDSGLSTRAIAAAVIQSYPDSTILAAFGDQLVRREYDFN